MSSRPDSTVPATGIYWCSVCKTPLRFDAGAPFPVCPNLCARGHWELVRKEEPR